MGVDGHELGSIIPPRLETCDCGSHRHRREARVDAAGWQADGIQTGAGVLEVVAGCRTLRIHRAVQRHRRTDNGGRGRLTTGAPWDTTATGLDGFEAGPVPAALVAVTVKM